MIKFVVKQKLEAHPRLYIFVLHLKRVGHWSRSWIVGRKTDITIEGYPRSGNSFAQSAFSNAQKEKYVLATHVHSSAQIVRSAQLQKPTMVLLRRPEQACLSLVALAAEMGDIPLETESDLKKAEGFLIGNFTEYRLFYERVLEVKEHIIIAEFSQVISDLGEVIRRVNNRFGTAFDIYDNSEDNDSGIFERGGHHLSPSETRDAIKKKLSDLLQKEHIQACIHQATEVYDRVVEVEQTQASCYSAR